MLIALENSCLWEHFFSYTVFVLSVHAIKLNLPCKLKLSWDEGVEVVKEDSYKTIMKTEMRDL